MTTMRRNAGNRHPDRLTTLRLGGLLFLLPTLAFAALPEPKGFRVWMAVCAMTGAAAAA